MGLLASLTGGSMGSSAPSTGNAIPALQLGQLTQPAGASPDSLDLQSTLPGLAGINPATSQSILSNLSAPVSGATTPTATQPTPNSPNPADSGIMDAVYSAIGGDGGSY